MASGNLPATRSVVSSWNLSVGSILAEIFPDGYLRLLGAQGLKFKLCFKLIVSAGPYHQGHYALSWQYGIHTPMGIPYTFNRTTVPAACTNVPHARLDISSANSCELNIPFLYQNEYMNMYEDSPATYGTLALVALLPTPVVSGAAAPRYQLHMHMEDIDIVAALPSNFRAITVQGGKTLKPIEEEFENDSYPYSSALHSASKTVSWISKGVPSISSIAGPTSWFLGKAAGVVRYFGYSKPQIMEPTQRTVAGSYASEMNVDVPSATFMVAPMASNRLRVDPQFAATDVDEMALAFVLSQYSQICVGRMTTTDTSGNVLYGTNISPSCFWYRQPSALPYGNFDAPLNWPSTVTTANAFFPSNLFFWGQMFGAWRGDLEFKITFSTSKFHGGRLLLSYVASPQVASGPSNIAPTILTPNNDGVTSNIQVDGYSTIFDLKDSNIVTFSVPYVSTEPYTPFYTSTGSFSMTILDPLMTVSTVSTSVDFMVEVRAKPDFELARFRGPRYPAHPLGTIRSQGGKMLNSVPPNVCELTMGECISSVKQIIMIPKTVRNTFAPNSILTVNLPPWYYHNNPSLLVPLVLPMKSNTFNAAGNAACCYLYANGSTDIHVYSVGSGAYFDISHSTYDRAPVTLPSPLNPPVANLPRLIDTDNHLHARLPSYQRTVRLHSYSLNNENFSVVPLAGPTFVTKDGNVASPDVFPRLKVKSFAASSIDYTISISAGDDARLGHYMGPPPLCLSNSTTAGPWDVDSVNIQGGKMLSVALQARNANDAREDVAGQFVTPVETFTNVIQPAEVIQQQARAFDPSMLAAALNAANTLTQAFAPIPPSPMVSGIEGVQPSSNSGRLTGLISSRPSQRIRAVSEPPDPSVSIA